MDNSEILLKLKALKKGNVYRTPDNALGKEFSIKEVTEECVVLDSSNNNAIYISIDAFTAANTYLHENKHDINSPVPLGGSQGDEQGGELCKTTRALNKNVRCITYIVPILAEFGAVAFTGTRPNSCWYI
ncbi:hypothetical protein VQ643_11580 [Pseudomonas sp. F1_0610]|uniref:hypothetical protein n=1 Tax=Pseudomonas sp. F1_0610 TaxID=3114284 RepID=UPI0039C48B4B